MPIYGTGFLFSLTLSHNEKFETLHLPGLLGDDIICVYVFTHVSVCIHNGFYFL